MIQPVRFENPRVIEGNVYFASDFHFGTPNDSASKRREEAVVRWLDQIAPDADCLFLLGDIFDFWFEYRDVAPKGNLLFLAKLLELSKKGVKIFYFTGNHDMWVKDYFTREMGAEVFHRPQAFLVNGKKCVVGHGDGLDPEDKGYLFIKKLFASKLCIALYGALPPRWAFRLARACSHKSRKSSGTKHRIGCKEEKLLQHVRTAYPQHEIDYFICGHIHNPLEMKLETGVTYLNTGDWLCHSSYVSWKNEQPQLFTHFENFNNQSIQ